MNKVRLSTVNFIQKSWSKSFHNGIVYNRVRFKCICTTISRLHSALLQTFYQNNWFWKGNGRLQFQKYPTHQCTKMSRTEILVFLMRNFPNCQTFIIWNPVFTLPLQIVLKPWALWFKKDTITAKTVSQLKCLEQHEKSTFTLQMKDLVSHFSVPIWVTFSVVMLAMILE